MELYLNTMTKACSLHIEHVRSAESPTKILTISVSEEVFDTLTKKAKLEEYFEWADSRIKEAELTAQIKNDFREELENLELTGVRII